MLLLGLGCLSPNVPNGGSGLDGGGGGGDGEGEARGELPTFFSFAGILSPWSMKCVKRSTLATVFLGELREASVANFPLT